MPICIDIIRFFRHCSEIFCECFSIKMEIFTKKCTNAELIICLCNMNETVFILLFFSDDRYAYSNYGDKELAVFINFALSC